jgi:arylsulfatase A-like enzyme
LKLADNTVVIFSSDNGGVGGYAREGIKEDGNVTDNAPLRGGKGMLYEGGIRVPHIVRWTGKVAKGTECGEPITSVDLYPTLLELAEAKPPADYPLDGKSYAKLLTSGGKGSLGRDAIYWHFPGYLGAGQNAWRTKPVSVIRSGDWKLMEFYEDNRIELYNLRDDLSEKNNLATQLPDKAKDLRNRLVAWRTELKAPMPTKNTETASAEPERKKKRKRKAQE